MGNRQQDDQLKQKNCHITSPTQRREQLEEKANDEEAEPVHGQWKDSIRRRLTLRLNCSSTECGTQPEEGSDIPGSLLDVIVERFSIALLQRPQRACTLEHFPHPQGHPPMRSRNSP